MGSVEVPDYPTPPLKRWFTGDSYPMEMVVRLGKSPETHPIGRKRVAHEDTPTLATTSFNPAKVITKVGKSLVTHPLPH